MRANRMSSGRSVTLDRLVGPPLSEGKDVIRMEPWQRGVWTQGSLGGILAEAEIRNSTWSILNGAHSHCQVAFGV
jgi:hypothetical protein